MSTESVHAHAATLMPRHFPFKMLVQAWPEPVATKLSTLVASACELAYWKAGHALRLISLLQHAVRLRRSFLLDECTQE